MLAEVDVLARALADIQVKTGARSCSKISRFQISEIHKKHKNVSRQTYNFLKVKLRRLREQI